MNKAPIKMTPGDDTHLTMLMAPVSLNLVTGADRENLLAYGRAAFEAGQNCQGCAVQQGYVPAEAVVQIQEPSPAPKNGYYDGDDDDEDGTPLFQSAEEVIRRSAEVRELRAGDVICIAQLVDDEHANQQHARLTAVDAPDAETELAWVFISNEEAKAYYEDKQAQKSTALHPKRVENVIFRMNKEGDSQAAETVQAQRDLIATLQSQLEAVGAGGVEPLRKPVQATDAEPFGYVNTHTGQFFKDVEPCRKNNEGHWRTVYTHPTQQGLAASNEWEGIESLPVCDDLIWLYCQNTNTVDGPIAPCPSFADSWTHWAYANAPSTAVIDAAIADKEKTAEALEMARNGGCGCCANACADRSDGCRFVHESPSAADMVAAQAKQGEQANG